MGLIIPKCNADSKTLDLTLRVYYDANDWVENATLIDKLSSYLIDEGIEEIKKSHRVILRKRRFFPTMD